MLLAVLEKRSGLPVGSCDSYINVIGGLSLEEPAADLATSLAVASSYLDRPLGADLAAIGEVGLSGEIRQRQRTESKTVRNTQAWFQALCHPCARAR